MALLDDGVSTLFFDDLFFFFLWDDDDAFCESGSGLSEWTAEDPQTEPELCEVATDNMSSDMEHRGKARVVADKSAEIHDIVVR